jgi:hypothetical protein
VIGRSLQIFLVYFYGTTTPLPEQDLSAEIDQYGEMQKKKARSFDRRADGGTDGITLHLNGLSPNRASNYLRQLAPTPVSALSQRFLRNEV